MSRSQKSVIIIFFAVALSLTVMTIRQQCKFKTMSADATVALVQRVSDRLRARYNTLDTVGLLNRPHSYSTQTSSFASDSGRPTNVSAAVQSNAANQHAQISVSNGQRGMTDPNRPSSSQTAVAKLTLSSPPPPRQQVQHVAEVANPSDAEQRHRELVARVMRDFGLDIDTHAAKTSTAVSRSEASPSAVLAGAAIVEPLRAITAETRSEADAVDELSRIDHTTSRVEEVFRTADSILAEEDGEIPRPQTPPPQVVISRNPGRESVARIKAPQTAHHDPNVLVVSGFEDLTNGRVEVPGHSSVAHTKTAVAPKARTPSPPRRLPQGPTPDLASPTFSSFDVLELIALSRVGLTAAKRDDLFLVAQRAFEGIAGAKDSTSSVYRTYANICRNQERNTGASLKSVNDVFASIATLTAQRHQQGNAVADMRATHRRQLVPGGCSNIAAEVVSKRLGRFGSVIGTRCSSASGPERSASPRKSQSPTRWPRRVISEPFVTQSLATHLKAVRHNSARRRTNSQTPAQRGAEVSASSQALRMTSASRIRSHSSRQ